MAIDVRGYNVPATPTTENQGLTELDRMLTQNKRWQYMIMKDKEMQDWRKANLVNELTDPSKYKTGSDVADGITNRLMTNVAQKYLSSAKAMNPLELEAGVKRDTSGVIIGANAVRDELNSADKQTQYLKQNFPELNIGDLYSDYRKAIVHKHLNDTGDDFKSPMEVGQTLTEDGQPFDISNPKLLSRYVTKTPGLDEAVTNPKGKDTPVAAGIPDQHIKWKANLPYFAEPSYTEQDLVKGGGYLRSGTIPTMRVKSTSLPTDFLPNLQGTDRKMVTSDVYQKFKGEHPLEVIAGARNMFNNYDQMNPNEQELAERDYLYQRVKSYEGKPFDFDMGTHTPASILKLESGETGGKKGTGELNINDVYGEIDDSLKDWESKGSSSFMPFQNLSQNAKDVLLPKVAADAKDKDIKQSDLQLIRGNDNSIRVFGKDNNYITNVGRVNTNLKAQPNVKLKTDVINQGEPDQTTQPAQTIKYKGKTYTQSQIQAAAKQSGMTIDEYKKELGL